jgi:hypothetical protein
MSDVRGHQASWLVGYAYIGNNTLGVNDNWYLVDQSVTTIIVPEAKYGNNVPIAPADPLLGASYMTDVLKHYSRIRINKLVLMLQSMQPSTTNSASVIVAPQRGWSNIGQGVTTATAGLAYATVLSMAGARSCAAWESMEIDMTSAIAGGSGAKQNEFNVNGIPNVTDPTGSSAAFQQIVPCTFALSGTNGTSAIRGANMHAVIAQMEFDLLDFVGANSAVVPVGLFHRRDEKKDNRASQTRDELKAESSDSELLDLPLTVRRQVQPAQDPHFTPANTPAGSRTTVKSLSLK